MSQEKNLEESVIFLCKKSLTYPNKAIVSLPYEHSIISSTHTKTSIAHIKTRNRFGVYWIVSSCWCHDFKLSIPDFHHKTTTFHFM